MAQHILIIDDDETMRLLLREILEKEGYEVSDAPNGAVGIIAHEKNPADLIITDMFMPEKEGISTIMDLNLNSPQTKIIAISGGGRDPNVDFLELARNLGAQHTLKKPFDKEELLGAVRDLLQ